VEKLRVMVVEDEYLVLMGLSMIVQELGHSVAAEAMNGEDAIKIAQEKKPDIILMDINLPGIDGIEAANIINRKAIIPIIMITGYSDQESIKRANEASVLAYLVKPVSRRDLQPALEIAVSRFKEIEKLKKEVQQTKVELENRKTIEKAKGIVMKHRNMDEQEAFKWMQQESRNLNIKLIRLAEKVIEFNKKH
jgi:response regulator NasT